MQHPTTYRQSTHTIIPRQHPRLYQPKLPHTQTLIHSSLLILKNITLVSIYRLTILDIHIHPKKKLNSLDNCKYNATLVLPYNNTNIPPYCFLLHPQLMNVRLTLTLSIYMTKLTYYYNTYTWIFMHRWSSEIRQLQLQIHYTHQNVTQNIKYSCCIIVKFSLMNVFWLSDVLLST